MDDNRRNQFDTNFARIVDQCNAQMQRATGDDEQQPALRLSVVSKIEAIAALQQKSAAEMMSVMIQRRMLSAFPHPQAKSLEKLTESDHKVINMHNEAMGILNEMANNAPPSMVFVMPSSSGTSIW